jgi:ADP-ribose pyrophosphatase
LIDVAVETWPAGDREIVRHPGAAAIVALTPDGDVILVRQFREAVRGTLLELPAGVYDVDGEDGTATALRELHEETGYRATAAEPLGEVWTSPGFADERIALFLARDAERTPDPPEDGIEVVLLPFGTAIDALGSNLTDAKTAVGMILASRALGFPLV